MVTDYKKTTQRSVFSEIYNRDMSEYWKQRYPEIATMTPGGRSIPPDKSHMQKTQELPKRFTKPKKQPIVSGSEAPTHRKVRENLRGQQNREEF